MPPPDLPRQLDAFLLDLPYPGQPSGGKHVAIVLSTIRFQTATGRALVAGLAHPKGHQRYPSHVVVSAGSFMRVGAGRPLPEERVLQLDQARTVPAPPRATRIGEIAAGFRDGRGSPDGYGLETAFRVHFQIEGYLERKARYGSPMRPVDVPGGAWPRGSVWRMGSGAGPRLVIVSNETYNEISDYVQTLEVGGGAGASGPSMEVLIRPLGGVPAQPGWLIPALRCVEKRNLQDIGRLDTAALGMLDRFLLEMIGD